jgi:hypothetical protein
VPDAIRLRAVYLWEQIEDTIYSFLHLIGLTMDFVYTTFVNMWVTGKFLSVSLPQFQGSSKVKAEPKFYANYICSKLVNLHGIVYCNSSYVVRWSTGDFGVAVKVVQKKPIIFFFNFSQDRLRKVRQDHEPYHLNANDLWLISQLSYIFSVLTFCDII